ncbi:MAG TPA: nuclear pore complex subunit [Bacteroidales bacterium]|nr:MAG: hypothetical protein A2W98_09860 [Bacteroidetes bacterium GWF2_33_38]OFY90934.1 MAG: hypothetical protein A2236_09830 [Bacteroidetes bacterium RIFOXYA2_FULL_33_7]HBF88638.1 nuclear pore complex subunit [Bacteroidales bacterium]
MDKIIVNQTSKTPFVSLDAEKGKIEILGISIPENPADFYEPMLSWIEQYEKNPCDSTIIDIGITYYNTSSSKWLLEFLLVLNKIYINNNKDVLVNWHYSDDDIFEAGKDYESLLEMPFHFIIEEE